MHELGAKGDMKFNMDQAWSRAIDLVKDSFQLLLVIAAVFLLLPSIGVYLFMPDFATLAQPGAEPEQVLAVFQENLATIVLVSGAAMIVQFAGQGAIIAMIGGKRPTVGEAIATGFRVTPSTLAIFVLYFVLYFVAAIVVAIPLVLIAALVGQAAGALVGVIAVFPILFVSVYLAARLSMSLPVLVLEGTLNPFSAMMRSFKLTHKRQWSILIFWSILFVVYMVIALLFSSGFGVIAALAGGGTATALILGFANGLMGIATSLIICGLAVAIFEQLRGPDEDEVSSVFE